MHENISAKAIVANGTMEEIILERYLSNSLPISNKFNLKKIYKYTGNNYYRLRNYIKSSLYTISKDAINITDDLRLLSNKSKEYIEKLIKKLVFPEKYKDNKCLYFIAELFGYSYYTKEENNFIELMSNELFSIIDNNEVSHRISFKDLIGFLDLNQSLFLYTAQQVYNDILHKKINAGDNIMKYIKEHLTDAQVTKKLEYSYKYDWFFDNHGILKCDLNTNTNILTKNFLSTIIYKFTDIKARTVFLLKLNSKFPFLISEKVFNEYD